MTKVPSPILAITRIWVADIAYPNVAPIYAVHVEAADGHTYAHTDNRVLGPTEDDPAVLNLVNRVRDMGRIDKYLWTQVTKTWDDIAEEWSGMVEWEETEKLAGRW
jgi:hypothetical protein